MGYLYGFFIGTAMAVAMSCLADHSEIQLEKKIYFCIFCFNIGMSTSSLIIFIIKFVFGF